MRPDATCRLCNGSKECIIQEQKTGYIYVFPCPKCTDFIGVVMKMAGFRIPKKLRHIVTVLRNAGRKVKDELIEDDRDYYEPHELEPRDIEVEDWVTDITIEEFLGDDSQA